MAENPYGYDHQQLRLKLLPLAYGTACPRCDQTMHPWHDLDLGHDDDDPTKRTYRGIEHQHCNRSAGAIKGLIQRGFTPSAHRRVREHQEVSVDPDDL